MSKVSDSVGKWTIVVLYLPLMYRVVGDIAATGRMTGAFLLLLMSLVVWFTLTRRKALVVDRSWTARCATIVGTFAPLLFRPGGLSLVPDIYTAVPSLAGSLLTCAGVLSLRQSFGLSPANRGVVTRGPYTLVRHPIYTGYLIVHCMFVVAHPTIANLIVWAVADTAMVVRILREERVLAQDLGYAAYRRRVTWRLMPAVW